MYRVGSSWGLTVVREGVMEPDEKGHRDDDRLVGLMLTPEDAAAVVEAWNAKEAQDAMPTYARRAQDTSPRTK